jgi:CreA protein
VHPLEASHIVPGAEPKRAGRMGMLLRRWILAALAVTLSGAFVAPAMAQEDLIFKKSTVWKALTPDDKLAVYGVDDPLVEGVACHYTVPEKGGVKGMFGVAEEVSEVSLACRQIGPIKFKDKAEQGDVVFRERRSLIWKKMQIVRGCDAKRNVLVYLVYSDKLIDGSPQNSTSTVPIMPWGNTGEAPKCSDWIR